MFNKSRLHANTHIASGHNGNLLPHTNWLLTKTRSTNVYISFTTPSYTSAAADFYLLVYVAPVVQLESKTTFDGSTWLYLESKHLGNIQGNGGGIVFRR